MKKAWLGTEPTFLEVRKAWFGTKPTFLEVRKAWFETKPTFYRGKEVSSDDSHSLQLLPNKWAESNS